MAKHQRFPNEESQDRRIAKAVCSAAVGDPELIQRLAPIDNRSPSAVIALFAGLVASHDETVQLRVSAADALLSASVPWLYGDDVYQMKLNIGLEDFARALADQASSVRIRACRLLGHTSSSPRVIQLLGTALDDPVPEVVLVAVRQLRFNFSLGFQKQHGAAELVPLLSKLIEVEDIGKVKKGRGSLSQNRRKTKPKADDETCYEVIRVFSELRELAIGGIKPLTLLALSEGCQAVNRTAAAEALAAIDPSGNRIISKVQDVDDIDLLTKMMSSDLSRSVGNSLRLWSDDIRRGPAKEDVRLRMKEIKAYIFGDVPTNKDEDDEKLARKRIDDKLRKRIEKWIVSGILRGSRVKLGHYDVRESDLERLKLLYHGKVPEDD